MQTRLGLEHPRPQSEASAAIEEAVAEVWLRKYVQSERAYAVLDSFNLLKTLFYREQSIQPQTT